MLEQIKQWAKPPIFPDDDDKTRKAKILYALLSNMLLFLLIATLATIFIFIQKTGSVFIIFGLLVWVLISRILVNHGRVLAASRLFVIGAWIMFTLTILLTGRISTAFVSLQLATTVMAGILLGKRSALALTLLSIVFGLGLTLLESTGYPLIQYFPVPPLSGWAVWTLTFILILTPLNPTIQNATQSAKNLRESETRFKSIYSQSPIAIELYDAEGSLIDVNAACLDLFGVTDVDAVKGFKLFDDPNVPENAKKLLFAGNAVNYQAVFDFELVKELNLYQTKKSGHCYLDCYITPWAVTQGTPSGYLVHVRDITERKRIETALVESQTKLSAIFDNSLDAILVAKAGIFVMVNPAFLRLHGYENSSELEGRSVLDLVAPKSQEMISDNIRRRSSGQTTPTFYEALVMKSDGTRFWVELSVSTYELDGEMYALAVERDITERKQVEAALLESKAKYKDLFEHVPVALWDEDFSELKIYLDKLYQSGVADLRTHFEHNPEDVVHCTELIQIIDVNQATLNLFEAETKEQLLGNLKRIFRTQSPTIIKEEIITLYGDKTPYQGEMLAMSLNGNSFHCHIEVAIAPEHEETWEKVFVSVTDITERKQMEEREHAQRTLAEALSNSAAALNSTLNFDDVLDYIIDNVGRVVPHDAANIMLLDVDNEKLSLVCHRGYVERGAKNSDIEQQFSLVTSLILREVARTGQPLAIPDTHAHPDWISISTTEWVNSYLTVPIQIRQNTVGFLNLGSETTGFFNTDHAERLQAFANHAAIAINNAQLYKDMQILAVTDALTGIYNRTFFETELARMGLSRDFPVSIIVADLDNLKKTNDTFGHTAGDELIKNVSQIFKETFRAADIISRIGGDEFAVLLPNTTSVTAEQMLPRIRTKIIQHNAAHPELPIQLSLGTATAEQGQLVEALTLADRRMYADKAKRKSSR